MEGQIFLDVSTDLPFMGVHARGAGGGAGEEPIIVGGNDAVLDRFQIGLVGQQLATFQRGHAGIDDHKGLEVQHPLDIAQRHIEQQADTRGQRFQEPDVCRRAGQLDVAHAFAAHLGQRDFHAALLADHTAMLEALVLAAQALVVLYGTKDLCTEQTIAFWLECTVVDGLRLLHFAVRPLQNLVRTGQRNLDGREAQGIFGFIKKAEDVLH